MCTWVLYPSVAEKASLLTAYSCRKSTLQQQMVLVLPGPVQRSAAKTGCAVCNQPHCLCVEITKRYKARKQTLQWVNKRVVCPRGRTCAGPWGEGAYCGEFFLRSIWAPGNNFLPLTDCFWWSDCDMVHFGNDDSPCGCSQVRSHVLLFCRRSSRVTRRQEVTLSPHSPGGNGPEAMVTPVVAQKMR